MRVNMIYTDKDGNLTFAPQPATVEQQATIERLAKEHKAVDGTYGRYSDGRISVNIGDGNRVTINQKGEIE